MNICFCALFLVSSMAGCSSEIDKSNPFVEVSFELLNMDMVPADTFEVGEDILCKLRIENLSNKELVLYTINASDENLLKLQKWSRLSDSSQEEGWVELDSPIKFFQTPYVLGYNIPTQSNLLLVLSLLGDQQLTIAPNGWVVEYNNFQLEKGRYALEINSFQATFSDSSNTPEKSFREEFYIK